MLSDTVDLYGHFNQKGQNGEENGIILSKTVWLETK